MSFDVFMEKFERVLDLRRRYPKVSVVARKVGVTPAMLNRWLNEGYRVFEKPDRECSSVELRYKEFYQDWLLSCGEYDEYWFEKYKEYDNVGVVKDMLVWGNDDFANVDRVDVSVKDNSDLIKEQFAKLRENNTNDDDSDDDSVED